MAGSEMVYLSQQFASDNYSGICPEAWAAMELVNQGHAPAYGEDPWTARAADAFRELFETDCEVFFAFNGTAANSLALASLCQSYHGVICSESAHVETDECGAPEFFSKWVEASSRSVYRWKTHTAGYPRDCHKAPGHSLSKTTGRHHHASHRDGTPLHAGGTAGDRCRVPGTQAQTPHRWSTFRKRLCQPRLLPSGADLEGGSRRALFWRDEERHGCGGSHPLL